MTRHQMTKYFDSGGSEIDAARALDHNGALRNGFSMRIPTTLRDSAAKPLITDGRTNDPTALHRPGFRIPVVNDRRKVVDAYAKYETGLVTAYRVNAYRVGDEEAQCPDCDGSGEDEDGDTCETCNGSGTVSASERSTGKGFGNEGHRSEDSRSVTRDQAYKDYDQALSSAWKNGRTG
jgi:hypothetical protein